MILETPRLLLRPHRASDVPAFLRLHSDPEVGRLLPRVPRTTVAEAEATYARISGKVARGEAMAFALVLADDPSDTMIGVVGFASFDRDNDMAHMAWELVREHWGKGLMVEAATAVIAHGFEALKLHRLEAHVDPLNVASMKLAERLSFVREGVLRANCKFEGGYRDTVLYARLRA